MSTIKRELRFTAEGHHRRPERRLSSVERDDENGIHAIALSRYFHYQSYGGGGGGGGIEEKQTEDNTKVFCPCGSIL